MRFSVGEYTTPRLSFSDDLAVYAEAGAEGIGIDAALKLRDLDHDLECFRASGLQATFCMPTTSTVFGGKLDRGAADPAVRADLMCDAIREMARFDPECIVLGTGPFADEAADRPVAVDILRRAVRVAAEVGHRVALEPLHSSLGPDWSYLTDLPGTLQLIDDIGEPDVGVLFDVWHLWDTPHIKELLAANIDAIYGVHVDDWRSPTRSWCDRVLPGDGIADTAGLLGVLREGGYDGWLELEIFSDDGLMEQEFADSLWREDPVDLIRRGRERTIAAWNADPSKRGT